MPSDEYLEQYRQKSLDFLRDPSRWPYNPLCPVRRPSGGTAPADVAVVAARQTGLAIAIGVNIFGMDSVPDAAWQETTAEQIVADGWYVD